MTGVLLRLEGLKLNQKTLFRLYQEEGPPGSVARADSPQRTARPRGQNGHAVMRRQLDVAAVDLRIVEARLDHRPWHCPVRLPPARRRSSPSFGPAPSRSLILFVAEVSP